MFGAGFLAPSNSSRSKDQTVVPKNPGMHQWSYAMTSRSPAFWRRRGSPLNCELSENCRKIFLLQNFRLKMLSFGLKRPFWKHLQGKLKFWAPIISSVGNSHLFIETLSEINNVRGKKLQVAAAPSFFSARRHDDVMMTCMPSDCQCVPWRGVAWWRRPGIELRTRPPSNFVGWLAGDLFRSAGPYRRPPTTASALV